MRSRRPKLNPIRPAKPGSAWDEIFRIVRRIPRGRVVNYGQVAAMLERSLSAQAVGWAMRQCPEGLPWHRVVNASGGCSTDGLGASPPGLQRAMLEAEGVRFGAGGTLELDRYRWRPRGSQLSSAVPAPGRLRRRPAASRISDGRGRAADGRRERPVLRSRAAGRSAQPARR